MSGKINDSQKQKKVIKLYTEMLAAVLHACAGYGVGSVMDNLQRIPIDGITAPTREIILTSLFEAVNSAMAPATRMEDAVSAVHVRLIACSEDANSVPLDAPYLADIYKACAGYRDQIGRVFEGLREPGGIAPTAGVEPVTIQAAPAAVAIQAASPAVAIQAASPAPAAEAPQARQPAALHPMAWRTPPPVGACSQGVELMPLLHVAE